MEPRNATVKRATKETRIELTFCPDGAGKSEICTGIGFFDHLLQGFARHGLFDLRIQCGGDLEVDTHHTIEDVGIVLGTAMQEALGDKSGIQRYGSAILPMDDALVLCAVDLSGRPYLSFEAEYTVPKIGDMDTEMIRDFFYAVSYAAKMNLHIKQISGFNNHHIAECSFKAFAKAFRLAVLPEPKLEGAWTTKGTLGP
ncbi:MAG: imidazoleglycerol-phosphate dehydratase HisB [Clostridium sp.]|jgi:imidazoleglycerol-phosphate dehydratase|nr:imidazoleglycerol-phosphate dehydratase HisB [Clostridium sp.]